MAEATVFVEQNSPIALLRQAGVLVGIAAAVALGGWVVMWSRTPHYSMLYSDLSDRDLTQVADALKSSQIPYRIDPDSGALMVESGKADDARLQLAAAGLPKGNSRGFELMEQEPSFGTSQFMEKARYQHAMEGELSRSIGRIDNVRAARVHLALPTESVFARAKREPSASVIVDLYGGRRLEPAQVSAITHLVSASVPNLPSSRVTVVDSRGNLLTDAKRDEQMAVTNQRFEYTRKLEQSYVDRVHAILEPFVGPEGVRAEVAADLDFTATEQTRETFNPDLPAVRSERLLEEERVGAGPGGVPGALSNSPPEQAAAPEQAVAEQDPAAGAAPADANAEAAPPQPTSKRSQTTRNYEIDRTISHTRQSVGTLRKLSVAVVLRKPQPVAVANPVAAGDPAAAPAPAAPAAPVEFTAEEIARMTQLVKDAVGFDAARGDTVSLSPAAFVAPAMPEPLPAPPLWEQPWAWDVGKQLLGGLFVLILFFGLLRPAVKSLVGKPPVAIADKAAEPAAPAEQQLALPPGAGSVSTVAETPALPNPAQKDLGAGLPLHEDLDQLKSIVTEQPLVAAQVIKSWVGDT
jgi:flagellar M-ring protein FliF